MIEDRADANAECATFRGRLSDIGQLSVWLDSLALRYSIPDNMKFAMNLCLEEVLSNIIRHGYGGADDRLIHVRFARPDPGNFTFTVDDEAPRFNPLEEPELTPIGPHREFQIGGQGIRLLRAFANSLEYAPTLKGNRLWMRFSGAD